LANTVRRTEALRFFQEENKKKEFLLLRFRVQYKFYNSKTLLLIRKCGGKLVNIPSLRIKKARMN
jgi:hypothetical protein